MTRFQVLCISAIGLVLCCGAFLAQESGNRKQDAVIDQSLSKGVLADIQTLKDEIESLKGRMNSLKAKKIDFDPNPKKGYLQIDDLLICWGSDQLHTKAGLNPHTRYFDFEFARKFTDGTQPAISTGFHQPQPPDNNGYTFGVYYSTLDNKHFEGNSYSPNSAPETVATHNLKVEMSYVAIGKAEPSPAK
jgi:hypothetical protein